MINNQMQLQRQLKSSYLLIHGLLIELSNLTRQNQAIIKFGYIVKEIGKVF